MTFMVGQSIEVREGIQQMEDPFWVQSRTSSIFMQVLVKKCPTVRGSPLTFFRVVNSSVLSKGDNEQ